MPRNNDVRLCLHLGCKGVQIFHESALLPENAGSDTIAREAAPDANESVSAWVCNKKPAHFDRVDRSEGCKHGEEQLGQQSGSQRDRPVRRSLVRFFVSRE